MIENILNELRNTDNHLTYGGIPYKNPIIDVQDAIQIVQEVAKEYGEKACVRCKHHLVDSDLEPCKYCIHLVKHIYKEDNFEPKDAPYQKGE